MPRGVGYPTQPRKSTVSSRGGKTDKMLRLKPEVMARRDSRRARLKAHNDAIRAANRASRNPSKIDVPGRYPDSPPTVPDSPVKGSLPPRPSPPVIPMPVFYPKPPSVARGGRKKRPSPGFRV